MSARGRLVEHMQGVMLATSDIWMTNTTVVVAGSRCLVIDAGLLPGELRALEDELAARGLRVEADALVDGRAVDDARLTRWPPMTQQHEANIEGTQNIAKSKAPGA